MSRLSERVKRITAQNAYYEPAPYVHSDDIGMGNCFRQISEALKDKPRPTLGLIVGTGGILTTVKDLPVEIYVVCDINRFILDWVDYTSDAMVRNETRENYVKEVYSSELAKRIKQHTYGGGLESDLQNEIQQIGSCHFLCSQDMYSLTRAVLPKREIITVAGDLTDVGFVHQLASAFRKDGLRISYLKIADVYEFAPKISESLPLLPVSDDIQILWSSRAESIQQNVNHPVARVSTGLQVYLEQARKSKDLFYLLWNQRFQR